MQPVKIRDLTIGPGRPKIVAPLTGTNLEELLEQAKLVSAAPVQMAEWRMDYLDDATDTGTLLSIAPRLRSALGELPLLATFRRWVEGGMKDVTHSQYAAVIEAVALTGAADVMDIELSAGEDFCRWEMDFCRRHGLKILLSSHDFRSTPGTGELLRRLSAMEALGADIAKIAVMPVSPYDVLSLLNVAYTFSRGARCPIAAMSMGPLGAVTRVVGENYGSALTFAAAAEGSAPGQLSAGQTVAMLEAFAAR